MMTFLEAAEMCSRSKHDDEIPEIVDIRVEHDGKTTMIVHTYFFSGEVIASPLRNVKAPCGPVPIEYAYNAKMYFDPAQKKWIG